MNARAIPGVAPTSKSAVSERERTSDLEVSAGVNRLEGVSFALQNDLPQRARALNIRLGRISEVIESGNLPRPETCRLMAAEITPVQPGQLRVEASVIVRYEIAP